MPFPDGITPLEKDTLMLQINWMVWMLLRKAPGPMQWEKLKAACEDVHAKHHGTWLGCASLSRISAFAGAALALVRLRLRWAGGRRIRALPDAQGATIARVGADKASTIRRRSARSYGGSWWA